ncbi:tRNA ligase [Savitreella phatthalungensis]
MLDKSPGDRGEALISTLEHLFLTGARLNGDKKPTVRCTRLPVPGTTRLLSSWRFMEFSYGKKPLPTEARGLFSLDGKIVVRGYDKFFSVDEIPRTKWTAIAQDTEAPYVVTLKQNGCIIFIGGLEDGTLLVTSKHSIGSRENDTTQSHSDRGHYWLKKHLASVGKTEFELAQLLSKSAATVVCELCDDEFEEHILPYSSDKSGLYLHGINVNSEVFTTYPAETLREFGKIWGLRVNEAIVKNDLPSLKRFLDECASTGTYGGSELEGFVIRCKRGGQDFFFKYKFEEPYLLYRQWREATKALIAGKRTSFKKHAAITDKYLDFVEPLLHGERAEEYQRNHGIISLREAFLAAHGPVDLAAKDEPPPKTVIVPVATIGCGKTTVALALQHLFGFGHVQNDNMKGGFIRAVAKDPAKVVIADRNNHMRHERDAVLKGMRARFIAMYFDQNDAVRKVAEERVLKRGDNHQSIQLTDGVDHVKMVMRGFHERFQPLDLSSEPDSLFDGIVHLDAAAGSRVNLEGMCAYLANEGLVQMPSPSDMDAAIQVALAYTPTTRKVVKSKVNFYALALDDASYAALVSALDELACPMWAKLREANRVQPEFHVTLVHSASKNKELWKKVETIKGQFEIDCIEAVWTEDVLCVPVRITLPTTNRIAHITIGTRETVKAVESNSVLERGDGIRLPISIKLSGTVKPFYR